MVFISLIICVRQKNPKEASNIFHSIMKASVTPNKVKYPVCGTDAKQIKGKDYECSNGHKFSE
jgi:pentatricopeptide repeat protein